MGKILNRFYNSNYFRAFLIILFLSITFLLEAGQTKQKPVLPKDLTPKYKQWLEEEVVYIITKKEKEVFLQLQTDRERDIFIEAFWRQRDPTPNTPENEFKTEHYRRIQHANRYFGKESPQPGWKTDMGKIYIILGEPKQIERYENQSDIYPVHVWFYEGMSDFGLPNAFYVVFFKKNNAGEFILYSPIRDGPQNLMIHYSGDMTDYQQAYRALYKLYQTLAEVSINLIPGEATMGITPTMTSDILIASKIPAAPSFKVKDAYAEKLLAYKDIVEVDYSANYIENDFLVGVFQDNRNIFYIHYLIEPTRLSFEQYSNRYSANLEIDGNIADESGKIIYQFERRLPIELSAAQLATIRNKFFSYQDIIPVIAGRYKINVIMKNTVSKEFTTVECPVVVPEPKELWMSSLLLANNLDRNSKYSGQIKPFLFIGNQLRPSPRNDFLQSDTMFIYLQVLGLTPELHAGGKLEWIFFKDTEPFKMLSRKVSDYPRLDNIIEEFPLESFSPAYYSVEVKLIDKAGNPILSQKAQFFTSPQLALARPWVLSTPFSAPDSPDITHILGLQLLNKKEINRAIPLLDAAFRRFPSERKYALDLARALFENKDFQRAKSVAQPFIDQSEEPAFLLLLGQASQELKDYDSAVSFYKNYLVRFGTNVSVLNNLGECHLALGQNGEALTAFEKSLQIEPNQEKIKAYVKTLKEKR